MAFAPGELSSLSFNLNEGVPVSIYSDILANTAYSEFIHTKPVRADELACPTWGLNDSSPYATIGPPYYPLVVLPDAILSLHPAWEKCKSNSVLHATPGNFDPPEVLTPVTSDDQTTTSSWNPRITPQAEPAFTRNPDLPKPTAVSVTIDSKPSAAAVANDLPANDSSAKSAEVEVTAKLPVTDARAHSMLMDDGPKQSASPSSGAISGLSGPRTTGQKESTLAAASVVSDGSDSNGPSGKSIYAIMSSILQDLGFMSIEDTLNAGGSSREITSKLPDFTKGSESTTANGVPGYDSGQGTRIPSNSKSPVSSIKPTSNDHPSPPPPPPITTIPSQPLSAHPSTITITGTTLYLGNPARTVSGHPLTFGPSGDLVLGTRIFHLPNPSLTLSPSTYTRNGKYRTTKHSTLSIQRAESIAGDVRITVFRPWISLDAGGTLHVGTGEVPLATMAGGSEDAGNATTRLTVPRMMSLIAATSLVVLVASLMGCWV